MAPTDFDSIRDELDEIRTLVKQQHQHNSLEKYAKIIQTIIYVLVLVVGIGASWGLMESKLATAAQATEKVAILEARLQSLEIKQATGDEILKMIRADISEIKDELKKITRGQH